MKKFIPRLVVARNLGVLPTTLAAWDRAGRGVGKRIFISSRFVVYRQEDVATFLRDRGEILPQELPQEWQPARRVTPRKHSAARGADVPRPDQGEAEPGSRAEARSTVLRAPAASTTDRESEDAPAETGEREP